MLITSLALIALASLILYALLGGADFGGGMWDLWASGPRAERQRRVAADAIAPIWEANHVWLILVIVMLFTAWPRAFAVMMTALHIPLMAMLMGIVLRGSAFIFRRYDVKAKRVQHRWSFIFGISSLATAFLQGLCLGALASGDIRVEEGRVITGFFAGWTGLFAVTCGLFALGLFSFLAAVYLTIDAAADREVQEDFRKRALGSGGAVALLAVVVFLAARQGGAPQMYASLTQWWAPVLLTATCAFAATALAALVWRRYSVARIAAIGQVALILAGWGVAQFPALVIPDVDIRNVAAPAATLRLLLIALILGAFVLLPSLVFLFKVFKPARADPAPGSGSAP